MINISIEEDLSLPFSIFDHAELFTFFIEAFSREQEEQIVENNGSYLTIPIFQLSISKEIHDLSCCEYKRDFLEKRIQTR